MANYTQKAQSIVDPQYAAKKAALQNALNSNLGTLDSSKTSQTDTLNQNNALNKNNISDSALNRGLGRSSIVTSGLAGADQANTKAVGKVGADIEGQKSLLNQAMQNTFSTMAGSQQSDIQTMANQLQQQDVENARANRQLALQESSNGATTDRLAWEKDPNNADNLLKQQQINNNNYDKIDNQLRGIYGTTTYDTVTGKATGFKVNDSSGMRKAIIGSGLSTEQKVSLLNAYGLPVTNSQVDTTAAAPTEDPFRKYINNMNPWLKR